MAAAGEGQAHEVVARAAGLSLKTFQRALTVIRRAPEGLKERVA
jgi:hypothetical protein